MACLSRSTRYHCWSSLTWIAVSAGFGRQGSRFHIQDIRRLRKEIVERSAHERIVYKRICARLPAYLFHGRQNPLPQNKVLSDLSNIQTAKSFALLRMQHVCLAF